MRASLLIAAHNEGDSLWKTIRACVEGCAGLDYEIVVADDASSDGSVRSAQQRYPQIRVAGKERRQGASPTKHLAAVHARGDVLVFLDGHCNPEPGAIRRLVEDVEELAGQAIVTPTIHALSKCWTNIPTQVGHGYRLGLRNFDCGWLPLEKLRVHRHGNRKFYESPALIGCALAIARELYGELHGFDPHMFYWGVEDIDFGLRSWLLGHPILHDPEAAVGHRFRKSFDNYSVPFDHLVVNQLRMARKNFTQSVWSEWLERCRQRSPRGLHDHPEGFWARAWELFQEHSASVESERAYFHARREHDEFWYAERFGLTWPKLASAAAPRAGAFADPSPSPSPAPSPSPPPNCGCSIQWANGTPITAANRSVLPGAQINLALVCDAGTPTNITWSIPGLPLVAFKSYAVPDSPSQNQDTAAPPARLAPGDLTSQTLQFYWVYPGNGREVTVDFTLNGQSCSARASFNVIDPTVAFPSGSNPPPIGSVMFYTPPPIPPAPRGHRQKSGLRRRRARAMGSRSARRSAFAPDSARRSGASASW